MKNSPDSYYSWGWSPYYVKEAEKKEKNDTGLILPEWVEMNQLNPDNEAAIVHWSTIKDGAQYSWLWLFEEVREAVALRAITEFLPDDSNRALIEATIPKDVPGQPKLCYVQQIPRQWLLDWPLIEAGIHEVWLGFDYKKFKEVWELKLCAQVFSVEEFQAHLKRSA
jgi:hypothetical protein